MKIAYLFGSLNRGGTETLMLDVCQSIDKDNFEAFGIYRKGGVLEQDFIKTGVPFVYLPVSKNIFKYLYKLRKSIISNKTDIVHAQQPIDAIFARLACIGTKVKVVLTFHGFDYDDNKTILKYIISRTDKNIFVSDYQRGYYCERYRLNSSKQEVIYNGVNFDKIKSVDAKNRPVSINSKIKFGTVGNFVPVREQSSLCKFLNLLKKANFEFDFYFAGARSEKEPWRYDECVLYCQNNDLSDCIHFLGSRNDVPQLLAQWDAFVYSTDHDTFGIAVVEAIASSTPVFVNDWAVMKEITQEGKLATLYKTKDENDLLEKFILFLQNEEEFKQKAKESAHIVREQYSIKKHIENTKLLYKELIDKP
ncbi:MAG: glycosyltransferase family 4 protein [Porphyromonadaceae bacterium]|nr:glycosyltransferase family 4 protein [Porphyromonadaceae bacterium]